jgi:hypothetical protein
MKGAIAMRHQARHGHTGSSRGFTLIELLKAGEIDPLPKDEEATVTEDNA